MRPAVFFPLRLRLSLENTAALLNSDSLTQLGTNFLEVVNVNKMISSIVTAQTADMQTILFPDVH